MGERAILLSMLGSWATAIYSYGKQEELRTTKPNVDLPITVYVYCSCREKLYRVYDADSAPENAQNAPQSFYIGKQRNTRDTLLSGSVIGTFVCETIREYRSNMLTPEILVTQQSRTLVTPEHLMRYTENHRRVYGWSVESPRLYITPRPLSDFISLSGTGIKSPPMSWEYVYLRGNR